MSLTRQGNTFTMTQNGDAYTGVVQITGLTWAASAAVAGEHLVITDTDGAIIADYLVQNSTIDNADLWNGRTPAFYVGFKITSFPGSANGTVTLFLD